MLAQTRIETGTEAVLQSGDEFVFIPRKSLKAAVQVFRNGQPLMWDSPIGPVPAYSLGAMYDRQRCIEHARMKAAAQGLQIGVPNEVEGELHVSVL